MPRGMKSCWFLLAEKDTQGTSSCCLQMRRKAVTMRSAGKKLETARLRRVVNSRNSLLAMWLALLFVTHVASTMAWQLPAFLLFIALLLWTALPSCLLLAWAFHASDARLPRLLCLLALLIGAVIAPLLALLVEHPLNLWVAQHGAPAQSLFSLSKGTLLFYGLCTPLVEEACKALGVLVCWRWVRATNGAVLLGVVAGSGFASVETGLYLFGQGNWGAVAVSRLGVVMVHAVATSLVGLGLSWLCMKNIARRVTGGALLAMAVGLHALFNVINLLAIPLSLDQPSMVGGVPLTGIFFLNLGFASLLCVILFRVLLPNTWEG